MTHTVADEGIIPSHNDTRKKRKKQARREAKIMLKMEKARLTVQKSEQKVAKAQSTLEDSKTYLRGLEERLTQIRSSLETPPEVENASSDVEANLEQVEPLIPQPLEGAEDGHVQEVSEAQEPEQVTDNNPSTSTNEEQSEASTTDSEAAIETNEASDAADKTQRRKTRRPARTQQPTEDSE